MTIAFSELLIAPGKFTPLQIDPTTMYLVGYSTALGSEPTRPLLMSDFLEGLAVQQQDVEFDNLIADEISATSIEATVIFPSTTSLTDVIRTNSTVSMLDIADGATQDQTFTVTGAAITDVLIVDSDEWLPAGLAMQGRITAVDTVTIRFINTSGSLISATDFDLKTIVLTTA